MPTSNHLAGHISLRPHQSQQQDSSQSSILRSSHTLQSSHFPSDQTSPSFNNHHNPLTKNIPRPSTKPILTPFTPNPPLLSHQLPPSSYYLQNHIPHPSHPSYIPPLHHPPATLSCTQPNRLHNHHCDICFNRIEKVMMGYYAGMVEGMVEVE